MWRLRLQARPTRLVVARRAVVRALRRQQQPPAEPEMVVPQAPGLGLGRAAATLPALPPGPVQA